MKQRYDLMRLENLKTRSHLEEHAEGLFDQLVQVNFLGEMQLRVSNQNGCHDTEQLKTEKKRVYKKKNCVFIVMA